MAPFKGLITIVSEHMAIFYTSFYGGLLTLVTILIGFLCLVLDEIEPMHTGKASLLKNDPGE